MSGCERPVAPLLTAELADLEGVAETDLGRHVRDCPHCSAAARRILAANRVLNASLAEEREVHGGLLITRARSLERAWRFDHARWRARWPALGLAAAAIGLVSISVVMLAVVARAPSGNEPISSQSAVDVTPQTLEVDAPGYRVAVIPTANPDLTIILFSREDDDGQQPGDVRNGPIAVGPANGL